MQNVGSRDRRAIGGLGPILSLDAVTKQFYEDMDSLKCASTDTGMLVQQAKKHYDSILRVLNEHNNKHRPDGLIRHVILPNPHDDKILRLHEAEGNLISAQELCKYLLHCLQRSQRRIVLISSSSDEYFKDRIERHKLLQNYNGENLTGFYKAWIVEQRLCGVIDKLCADRPDEEKWPFVQLSLPQDRIFGYAKAVETRRISHNANARNRSQTGVARPIGAIPALEIALPCSNQADTTEKFQEWLDRQTRQYFDIGRTFTVALRTNREILNVLDNTRGSLKASRSNSRSPSSAKRIKRESPDSGANF